MLPPNGSDITEAAIVSHQEDPLARPIGTDTKSSIQTVHEIEPPPYTAHDPLKPSDEKDDIPVDTKKLVPDTVAVKTQDVAKKGENLWIISVAELSPEDQENLQVPGSDDLSVVRSVLEATEQKKQECVKKLWTYTNRKGEKVILRDVLDKICVWIRNFQRIGDIAVQYDPGHAALPWAAVRFFLQLAVNDSQRFGAVLEGMELISHLISRYAIFEDLYLRQTFEVTVHLRQALIKLYATILQYLSKAKKYYSQRTVKRMLHGVVQIADNDFARLLTEIVREQSNVEAYARLVDAEFQRSICDTLQSGDKVITKGHEELKTLLKDLERPINRIDGHLQNLHDNLQLKKRRELLKWISAVPYEQYHENIGRDRLAETGCWLLNKEEYGVWRKSSASSILWLHGIPGSGKSKLASLVVDDFLEGNSKNEVHEPLAYFYCARNTAEPERADPEEIFRSLVRQLSCLKPGYPILPPVAAKYAEREERNFGFTKLRTEECIQLLLELSKIYPSITIVIDALDECDPKGRPEFLEQLDELLQQSTNLIKIFVTSRDDSDIASRLISSPNLYIKASDNLNDIRRFVEVEVDKAVNNRRLLRGEVSDELKDLVINTLITQAHGMFRWVSLQLQNLCNARRMKMEADVREELGRLPEKLADIYAEIYEQINESGPKSRVVAERALKWLLCGQRRLTTDEFVAAMSIDLSCGSTEVTKSHILDICCNLVVMDMDLDAFRFAHLSVREYLETRSDYKQALSHSAIAEASLSVFLPYNDPEDDESGMSLQHCRSLRSYATLYWPVHCEGSADQRYDGKLRELFQNFFWHFGDEAPAYGEWAQAAHAAWPELNFGDPVKKKLKATLSSPPNPLFVASVFGFKEVAEKLSTLDGVDLEKRNRFGERALHVACSHGHLDVTRVLLEKGVDINASGGEFGSALQAAAYRGHEAVLRLLLKQGADVNMLGGRCGSALQAAAEQGHHRIVGALLEHGADVNAKGGTYDNALQAAAKHKHEKIVRLLLQRGADVNAVGGRFDNALRAATWESHLPLVKLLLENGADIHASFGVYGNVLQVAAYRGCEAVVRLLLERGADVNMEGGQYSSALRAAIWGGNELVVRLLLDEGADVHSAGGKYGNALQTAAWVDNEAVVKLLLERGAQVNAEGSIYGSALQAAAVAGNESVIRLLLLKGAQVNQQCGLFGNALQAASERGHEAVVRLLLENGADLNNEGGVRGSALQAASWGGNETVVELLLEKGADVEAKTGLYGNALQMGALRGKESVVMLLVGKVDVNAVGGKFCTALQAAGWNDSVTVTKLLVEHGADVNITGGIYGSALQAAAAAGNVEAVRLLLSRGADVNAQGGYYGSALQAAIAQGNDVVVGLLEEAKHVEHIEVEEPSPPEPVRLCRLHSTDLTDSPIAAMA